MTAQIEPLIIERHLAERLGCKPIPLQANGKPKLAAHPCFVVAAMTTGPSLHTAVWMYWDVPPETEQ